MHRARCVTIFVLLLLLVVLLACVLAVRRRPSPAMVTGGMPDAVGSVLSWESLPEVWEKSNQLGKEIGGWLDPHLEIGEPHGVQVVPPTMVHFHTHPTYGVAGTVTDVDRYGPPSGADVVSSMKPDGKTPGSSLVIAEKAYWLINPPNIPEDKRAATEWYLQVLKWSFISGMYGDDAIAATDIYIRNAADPSRVLGTPLPQKFLNYVGDQLTRMYHRPDLAALCKDPPSADAVAPVTIECQLR